MVPCAGSEEQGVPVEGRDDILLPKRQDEMIVEGRLTRQAHPREVLVDYLLDLPHKRWSIFVQVAEEVLEVLSLESNTSAP
jgi:hypothetical protein